MGSEMSLAQKIARRRRALKWFDAADTEPERALFGKRPSTRLCRLMHREELLTVGPVGQFGFNRWRVSSLGRHLLDTAPVPRERERVNHA
jgi:hypothetical protein